MNLATRTKSCPACGQPNACARAADPAATDCWCKSVVVPPQLLAQVREKFPSAACLCRACLEREDAAMNAELATTAILPASRDDLPTIAALAGVIWRAVYPGIITREQIEYMLARMYEVGELERQVGQGTVFLRLLVAEKLIGFAAHSPTTNPAERKLDKLYIHPDHQRHGHGSRMLHYVVEAARALGCTTLMLTVNKRNTKAIAAYEKNGFVIRGSIVTEIGGGFVMDDYVMMKEIWTWSGQSGGAKEAVGVLGAPC